MNWGKGESTNKLKIYTRGEVACWRPTTKYIKPRKVIKKQGRNEPCACGSGKKYKRCCL